MIFKFALRSVMRNKRRTFLTALSIFFASIIVVLSEGWVSGAIDLFVDNYVKYEAGHLKIMDSAYARRERFLPVEYTVTNLAQLIRRLRQIKGVAGVEPRIRFGLLLGKGEKSVYAIGVGLDLLSSKMNLPSKVIEGRISEKGIVIGAQLAQKLGIKLGDRLLIATKTTEGGLNALKLPVTAIVKFNISMYDRKFFFIDLKKAQKLLRAGDQATEILVYKEKNAALDLVEDAVKSVLPSGAVVKNFIEQMGPMYRTYKVYIYINYFIEALILFLASFVIMNTLIMSIFERINEIGTLKALGMTDGQLFTDFVIEGGVIGLLGGLLGSGVGYLLCIYFSRIGIDMGKAMENMDLPFEYIFRPTASIRVFIFSVLMTVVITSLASMIPARYVRRFTPAEALRRI